MNISKKSLSNFSNRLGIKSLFFRDSILLTVNDEQYEFRGNNRIRTAWIFLYQIAEGKSINCFRKWGYFKGKLRRSEG